MTSFPKAKILRFNEISSCAPPPGRYDPKYDERIPGAVIGDGARFPEVPVNPSSLLPPSSTPDISFRTPQVPRRNTSSKSISSLPLSSRTSRQQHVTREPKSRQRLEFVPQDLPAEQINELNRIALIEKDFELSCLRQELLDLKASVDKMEENRLALQKHTLLRIKKTVAAVETKKTEVLALSDEGKCLLEALEQNLEDYERKKSIISAHMALISDAMQEIGGFFQNIKAKVAVGYHSTSIFEQVAEPVVGVDGIERLELFWKTVKMKTEDVAQMIKLFGAKVSFVLDAIEGAKEDLYRLIDKTSLKDAVVNFREAYLIESELLICKAHESNDLANMSLAELKEKIGVLKSECDMSDLAPQVDAAQAKVHELMVLLEKDEMVQYSHGIDATIEEFEGVLDKLERFLWFLPKKIEEVEVSFTSKVGSLVSLTEKNLQKCIWDLNSMRTEVKDAEAAFSQAKFEDIFPVLVKKWRESDRESKLELEELKSRYQHLESENESLVRDVHVEKSKCDTLLHEVEKKTQLLIEADAKREESQRKYEEIQRLCEEQFQEIGRLEVKVTALDSEMFSLKADLSSKESRCSMLTKENIDHSRTNENLLRDVCSDKSKLDALMREVEQMTRLFMEASANCEEIQRQYKEQCQEKKSLEVKVAALDSEISILKADFSVKESCCNMLTNENAYLAEVLSDGHSKLESAVEELLELKVHNKTLESKIDELRAEVLNGKSRCDFLSCEVAEKTQQLARANAEVDEVRQLYEMQRHEVEELHEGIVELESKVVNLEYELSEEKSVCDSLRDKVAKLERTTADISSEVDKLKALNSDERKKNVELERDLANEKGQNAELSKSLNDGCVRIELLEKKLSSAKVQLLSHERRISELEKAYDDNNRIIEEERKKFTEEKSKMTHRFKHELCALKQAMEPLREKISQKESELADWEVWRSAQLSVLAGKEREKAELKDKLEQVQLELETITTEYAKAVGHHNMKQRILRVQQMSDHIVSLKKEKEQLQAENSKLRAAVLAQQPSVVKQLALVGSGKENQTVFKKSPLKDKNNLT